RDDRPAPSIEWTNAIRSFASQHGLQIAVVSQVRMDNVRGSDLVKQLQAQSFLWEENVGHIEQEEIVRELYLKTRIVISDRLHVLIAAITNGALPSVILTQPSDKIKEHFDVVGIENITCLSSSEDQLINFLNE